MSWNLKDHCPDILQWQQQNSLPDFFRPQYHINPFWTRKAPRNNLHSQLKWTVIVLLLTSGSNTAYKGHKAMCTCTVWLAPVLTKGSCNQDCLQLLLPLTILQTVLLYCLISGNIYYIVFGDYGQGKRNMVWKRTYQGFSKEHVQSTDMRL